MPFDKDQPLVSIIIPTYNRRHTLGRAIDSVLQQTYPSVEIVVVDDGSTDNTKDWIEKNYANHVQYIYQSRRGSSAARNTGIRLAHGKWIGFLDSDDYFVPECLERKRDVFLENPDVQWLFTDQRIALDEENNIVEESVYSSALKKILENTDDLFKIFLTKNVVAGPITILMKRECLEKVHGYDEQILYIEDYDFCLRLAQCCKGKFIPQSLSVQVRHQESKMSNRDVVYESKLALVDVIQKKFPNEVRKYHWPPRFSAWRADIYNHFGLRNLKKNNKKEARQNFIRSIRTWPFQKMVYWHLLKSFGRRAPA
ncbi:MAG: glycosyltransferase [Candidatus Omnitrophica bacterium]|nr:glycosyltransferase [Candidatus Omnitrophota bacterium]